MPCRENGRNSGRPSQPTEERKVQIQVGSCATAGYVEPLESQRKGIDFKPCSAAVIVPEGVLVGAEIWDTLRAVTSDLDNPSNPLILESAGIIVHGNDLRTSYDERG